MPIFWESKNLIALDFSSNNFIGNYPIEYFDSQYFWKVEFLMANFNP